MVPRSRGAGPILSRVRALGMLRSLGTLTALLVGADFLDELSSGMPFVSSPEIRADFGVSYGQAAGWLLAAAGALAAALAAPSPRA